MNTIHTIRAPLSKKDVIRIINREGGAAVPLCMCKWWGDGYTDSELARLEAMAAPYPEDIATVWYTAPGTVTSSLPDRHPEYRFGYKDYSGAQQHNIGKDTVLLDDWGDLDVFLAHFPSLVEESFDGIADAMAASAGRYTLGCFWHLFHERLWKIRGMENLMIDYYDNMDGLKTLCRAILELHKQVIDRYHALGCDGIFSSDDLGHQSGPMMSPAIFEELYLPFYREYCDYIHQKGMHVFLHSCGDNTKLMPFLIDAGVDVFHPVQTGCMDYAQTAAVYGESITFLAGFDVQQLLPFGSEREVEQGVKDMLDAFWKPEGGLLVAAGNGIMPGTPIQNIETALRTLSSYIGGE